MGVKNKNGTKIDPTKWGKNKNELKLSQKVGVKVTDQNGVKKEALQKMSQQKGGNFTFANAVGTSTI